MTKGKCSECGIKTSKLSFYGSFKIFSYEKNRGKLVCGDCHRKLDSGEDIVWVGDPSKQTLKLIAKIKKLGFDVEPRLERLRTGHHQRSVGGWSWSMRIKNYAGNIGSQWTVKEILKAKTINVRTDIGSVDLIPEGSEYKKKIERWA